MWEFRHLKMPDLIPQVPFLYNNSMKKDMKIRQIFLDMDGVLSDFESKITEMLGSKVWNDDAGHKVYDDHKRELTSKHMFRRMDPLPDAWKLTDWCLNSGIHTEILTAAGTVNREIVVRDKIEWIREHINPYWTVIPTFKGSQKAAFAHKKAVLIDDRDKNIELWIKAGGIGILHTTADNTIKQLNDIINSD
jgi:5'(3')-deoxyribonucleotidase|tara:strand:- start:810 stop:1385 length:576 start_codon:yes stop_codon:yes gene_type:complete